MSKLQGTLCPLNTNMCWGFWKSVELVLTFLLLSIRTAAQKLMPVIILFQIILQPNYHSGTIEHGEKWYPFCLNLKALSFFLCSLRALLKRTHAATRPPKFQPRSTSSTLTMITIQTKSLTNFYTLMKQSMWLHPLASSLKLSIRRLICMHLSLIIMIIFHKQSYLPLYLNYNGQCNRTVLKMMVIMFWLLNDLWAP